MESSPPEQQQRKPQPFIGFLILCGIVFLTILIGIEPLFLWPVGIGFGIWLFKSPRNTGVFISKNWGGLLAIGALCFIIYHFSRTESELKGTAPQQANTLETHSQPQELQTVNCGPSDILRAYVANEVKADELYRGKKIRTHGVVRVIKRDFLNHAYVLIQPHLIEDEFFGIQCYFDEDNSGQAANLQQGQFITVEGIGGPYNMTATLYHSSIVN